MSPARPIRGGIAGLLDRLRRALTPAAHPRPGIGGELYWDGGFLGNPALFPLLLDPTRYRRNRVHRIDASDALAAYTASSKLDTSWDLFRSLHETGRATAAAWLATHFDDIGERTTLDIRGQFL